MATPVGPVAPDPDDPDLWDEWYDDEEEEDDGDYATRRHTTPVRLIALLVAVGLALLIVFAR